PGPLARHGEHLSLNRPLGIELSQPDGTGVSQLLWQLEGDRGVPAPVRTRLDRDCKTARIRSRSLGSVRQCEDQRQGEDRDSATDARVHSDRLHRFAGRALEENDTLAENRSQSFSTGTWDPAMTMPDLPR